MMACKHFKHPFAAAAAAAAAIVISLHPPTHTFIAPPNSQERELLPQA
jgi:TRAP-type C4-dicarboxylate transport system permease large subunit